MEGDIRVSELTKPVGRCSSQRPQGRGVMAAQCHVCGWLKSVLPCCLFQDPFPRRPETWLRSFVSPGSKVMRWQMVALPSGHNSTPTASCLRATSLYFTAFPES